MNIKPIKNRFRVSRLNAGYTQRDVHKILKYISYQALSHYENGNCIPNNMVLYSLPKLYNVSLDYLLSLDDFRNHQEYLNNKLGLDTKSIEILKNVIRESPQTTVKLSHFIKNILNIERDDSICQ